MESLTTPPTQPVIAPQLKPVVVSQPEVPHPLPKNNTFLLVGLAVVLVLTALIGYLVYQNNQLQQQLTVAEELRKETPVVEEILPDPTTVPKTTLTQTPSVAPTGSNLSRYQSTQHKMQFDHPQSWTVQEVGGSIPSISITKGEYSITMQFPNGFGPAICVFPDHPDYTKELEGPIGKCGAEYVVIAGAYGELRRYFSGSLQDPTSTWSIYSKPDASSYFVGVPLISYEVPQKYDQKILKEMDAIVATYQASGQ